MGQKHHNKRNGEKEAEQIENIFIENKETEQMIYAIEIAMKEMKQKGEAEGKAEGKAEGMAQGRTEGIIEGEFNAKLKIAKNLISIGMSIDQVGAVTGLPTEEIQKLQN